MINLIKEEYLNIKKNLKNLETLKNKSIVITGASGLIGSYLVNFLLFLNEDFGFNINIYSFSRNKERLATCFKSNSKNLFLIEQDLNESFQLSIKPDYIVHAASNAHPKAFAQDPVGTMKTNLLGTINLLESLRNTNCKFLYISTGEIYGNNTEKAFIEDDLGMVDSKIARSCYPESKRAAETLCVSYSEQYNIQVNIARLCYVYGSTITDTNSRADAQFLRNALAGENIVMKSEGLQRRTYCYVADCISALLTILISGINKEFYNIANPNSVVSVREYAETLADLSGVKLIFDLPDEIERKGFSKQLDSILDSSKLQKLGWEPLYDIKQGLKNTLILKKSEV